MTLHRLLTAAKIVREEMEVETRRQCVNGIKTKTNDSLEYIQYIYIYRDRVHTTRLYYHRWSCRRRRRRTTFHGATLSPCNASHTRLSYILSCNAWYTVQASTHNRHRRLIGSTALITMTSMYQRPLDPTQLGIYTGLYAQGHILRDFAIER